MSWFGQNSELWKYWYELLVLPKILSFLENEIFIQQEPNRTLAHLKVAL